VAFPPLPANTALQLTAARLKESTMSNTNINQTSGVGPGCTKHGAEAAQAPTLEIMQRCPRWLLWREEPSSNPEGKPRKVPYYINGKRRSGALDSPEDLQQLAGFNEANQMLSQGGYTGLAFALGLDVGNGGHWQGIDLDNIESNHLSDLANNAPGYVEFSPSRLGIHAIGYGRGFNALGSNGTGVEAYSAGRFFTFTSEVIRDSGLTCLADYVVQRAAPAHGTGRSPASSFAASVHVEPRVITELRSALFHLSSDEYKLWTDMGLALYCLGDTGRGLWMDWSATSSKFNPSEAAKKWPSLKSRNSGYQTVFHTAQQRGWVNPRSNEAQLVANVTASNFEIDIEEASEVTIEYLDNPWIPKGLAIGFYGRGESGKSSAVATFCSTNSASYSTLWITSEEAEAHIKKRHQELGSLPNTLGTLAIAGFDLYTQLESAIQQAKDKLGRPLGFVVLDSVSALVTWGKGESPNDEASVKRLVGHIDRLAQENGVSILMIGHMNKSKGREHIADTVSGSLAWTSSTRLSYTLQKLPEQDYMGFMRTVKSNLGAHFGSFYQTVPVHTMAPNIDGYMASLCGVKFEGSRIYGQQALTLAMADDDDPVVKKAEERQDKVVKVITTILTFLSDGALKTRADIEAEFPYLGVTKRQWPDVDKGLQSERVLITSGQKNMKQYHYNPLLPV
tara:strand:- start:4793 stop:6826 length:2034 start_codon:yes stop_codon:yes gene_type:complete